MTRILTIDIETNGLLKDLLDFSSFPYKLLPSAKLWTVVVRNVETGEAHSAEKECITKNWLKTILHGCDILVAHNGLKFDFLVLQLFDVLEYRIGYLNETDTVFGEPIQIVDTLLLSRLLSPDRYDMGGGHSLKTWGLRLGDYKDDYRQKCVEAGYIEPTAKKGEEFLKWNDLLLPYCTQDNQVTGKLFLHLWEQFNNYSGWALGFKAESKIADKAVRRENLGFWFDRDLAIDNINRLEVMLKEISNAINPILPPKPCNKTELDSWTPPKNQLKTRKPLYLPKVQLKKSGEPSAAIIKFMSGNIDYNQTKEEYSVTVDGNSYVLPYYDAITPECNEPSDYILNFAKQVNGRIEKIDSSWVFFYKDRFYDLPFDEPLETEVPATVDSIDFVKQHLIDLGWQVTEWKQRDLTKDSKKQAIPYEKRVIATERYINETLNSKYKEQRLEALELTEDQLRDNLMSRIGKNRPVFVPTAPCIRVGVTKVLCPNLEKLGDKVAFAKDFALYLTYKHRKNSIAGGVDEDFDYNEECPPTGFLAQYRESDGRIPTPAVEVACNTHRMKHIGVANIPKANSIFGREMRSLFCAGKDAYFYGYDHSSLEGRTAAHYVFKYEGGKELAVDMVAEKPNSIHCKNAVKLKISRDDAKAFSFGIMFGAQAKKLAKMLGISVKRAEELYKGYWDNMIALAQFKEAVENFWLKNGKTYIPALDGRKVAIRSQHSIVNAAIQSAGALCAKYTSLYLMQLLEEKGLCTDPFIGKPDCCEMVLYHDEEGLYVNKNLFEIKKFPDEDSAKQFVSDWKGSQLSAVSHINNWFIVMPNIISETVTESLRKTEEILKLRVPLAVEWKLGRNWYECH
jgi:predicted PolB exonuclease-like 3'-5' exonuclease